MIHRTTTLQQGDTVRIVSTQQIAFAPLFFKDGDVTTVRDVQHLERDGVSFDVVMLVIPQAPRSSVGFTVTPSEFHALVKIEEAE